MNKKVGVVGAGLSGLACAVELKNKGFDVVVFEQDDQAGGRVKTDEVDGFKLDHGFQVYLPAYEMGQKFFDHKSLELKGFSPGSEIFYNDKFHKVTDPLRDPVGLIATLSSPIGSLKDKMLILKLRKTAADFSESNDELKQQSTYHFLKDFGFSEKMISTFFKPFFKGVFLEKNLDTPASFFLYLFHKFSNSEASLPRNGMQSLISQLVSQLDNGQIQFKSKVKSIADKTITIEGGKNLNFEAVVLASENQSLLGSAEKPVNFNSVCTYYFKTRSQKFSSKFLFLNSNEDQKVNHVACITAVQKDYAPEGWELFSVNVLSDKIESSELIKSELEVLFGKDEVSSWEFLKAYLIKRALPSDGFYGQNKCTTKNGVYLCGDYMESPSIQGALSSGVKVAEKISLS